MKLALVLAAFFAASIARATVLQLSWKDNATGETGFLIERSTDGVKFDKIATAPEDAQSFDDADYPRGVVVWYRLSAVDDRTGRQGPSAVASFDPKAPTPTPTPPPLSDLAAPTLFSLAEK